MKNLSKLSLILALIAVLALPFASLQAQDGPNATDVVSRLEEAAERLDNSSGYILEVTGTDSQIIAIDIVVQQIEIIETREELGTLEIHNTADGVEGYLNATQMVSISDLNGDSEYSIDYELYFVDDVLYINPSVDGMGEIPDVTPGWQVIESPDSLDFDLVTLDLEDLFDPEYAITDFESVSEALEYITTVEYMVDDEGNETYIMTITGEDLQAFYESQLEEESDESDDVDPLTASLNDAVLEAMLGATDALAEVTVIFDADGNLIALNTLISISVEGLDLTAIAPDQFPEGSTMTFQVASQENGIVVATDMEYEDFEVPVLEEE